MIAYFARHPVAANLLMAAILILGLASLPNLQRETFPRIPATDVEVRAVYPGATAEEVEEAVCLRLEDAIDGVENLAEVRCEARDSLAIAVAEMAEGNDLGRFMNDVTTQVEAIDSFPAGVEAPVVRDLGRTDFVASVAVTGPMEPVDLKAYAEDLKERMQRVPQIATVEVRGFSDLQIRIEIPAASLRQYGLTVEDVAAQIGRQSIGRPTGTLQTRGGDLILRFDDERKRARAFHDIVIVAGRAGGQVTLGDIASIDERFERAEEKVIYNGKRAAQLDIIKTQSQDSLDVMKALRGFLDVEAGRAPPGVSVDITADMTSITRDRLDMLTGNGMQGLVLVFLTMWLFFSLRYSFWVSMGLPVSFLGALFMMSVFGYSLNMITMVALIIAIGLLMDDAIVIAENIQAQIKRGLAPMEAAIHGARQVAPGVVSSFLTTVLVFGSLAFMDGRMGAILKVLPVILIMVLAVSLVEAFLILPHHLAHSLEKMHGPEKQGRFRLWFEARFDHFRTQTFGRLLDRAIAWRYLTVGLLVGLLILSLSLIGSGLLKFQAFPDLDGDVVEARILLPQGTPLERTEAVVAQVIGAAHQVNESFRARQPGKQDLVQAISQNFSVNIDAFETGPHVATVTIDLLSAEVRDATIDEITEVWRATVGPLPDVIFLKFAERGMGPAGKAIEIRLIGDDLGVLKAASQDLMGWLSRYQGVHDLFDDLRPGKPELKLRLKDGAGSLGLTAQAIAGQLASAFQGVTVSELQRGANAFEVDVRLAESDRDSLADIDDFTVTTASGAQVPLSAVAVIEYGRGFARINRADGRRVVTIQGEVNSAVANASQIIAHTNQMFVPGLLERHPGVSVGLKGQAEQTAKTAGSVKRNFAVGLIGIFLLLAFQFRNYVEPFIVMAAIPMGFIGAFWGHLLQGLPLSMPSVIGFASLAGVVVNDTILLVHFIKMRRAQGATAEVAARQAGRGRFRAILLTSLTTIMGLTPLLLETSLQAQVMIPLATSLAFGLVSATVLSLFLVPSLYMIFADFGWTAPIGEADRALAAEGLGDEALEDEDGTVEGARARP